MIRKILIDRFYSKDYSIEKKIFGSKYKLISLNGKKLSSKIKFLSEMDGVLAWHENEYNQEILDKLKKCKIITRVGVGFNNVDLNYSRSKNIVVCNVPDYGINDVADHAITLLLMLVKKINYYSENIKNKLQWKWGDHTKLKRIQELTLGILGCGRIGSAVAIRAKAFGMKVIFYDPYVSAGYEKTLSIFREENLNTFLSKIDALSIHTPLTSETKNIVDSNFLKKLKKRVIIINTARGSIVDSKAIYKYLNKGHIGGVGFDVYNQEPPKKNDKLYMAWKKGSKNFKYNVIFTPHNAFFNKESYIELREKAALNIKNYFEKNRVNNRVN